MTRIAFLLLSVLCLSNLFLLNEGVAAEKSPSIKLASVSAIAMDANTGEYLVEKNSALQVPIASLTKVMTAMVVLDGKQSLKEKIQFTKADRDAINNYFSRIRLGSELPRGEVLRIALMSSENLAAAALANNYPGGVKAFVAAMNAKAKALGMHNSHFVDSSGLSTGNVSTAADVAKMVKASAKYAKIREYSTTKVHTANFSKPAYRLGYVNTNSLVRYERWDVEMSKTGYLDEAGRCLVMQTKLNNKPVVMVMLDSLGKKSPLGDAGRIRRWLENGTQGTVASSAWNYQHKKISDYMAAQPTAMR